MKKSRLFSVLYYLSLLFAVEVVYVILFGAILLCYMEYGISLVKPPVLICYVLLLFTRTVGFPVMIVMGCLEPRTFQRRPDIVRGLVGCIGAAGAILLFALQIFLFLEPEHNYVYEYDSRRDFALSWTGLRYFPVTWMMPPSAMDIRVSGVAGTRMVENDQIQYSCRVTEDAFRAFAIDHDYALATNSWWDANFKDSDSLAHVNHDSKVFPSDCRVHRNVLTHCSTDGYDRGFFLAYDCDEQILYGHWDDL